MSKIKVKNDIKSNAKVNDLKIKRNQGDLTSEVMQMCNEQLKCMKKIASQHASAKKDYTAMITALNANPQLLALVCQLADDYVEVIRWNKLINEKKLEASMIISHRETDFAMCSKIAGEVRKLNIDGPVFHMLYNYGHAVVGW